MKNLFKDLKNVDVLDVRDVKKRQRKRQNLAQKSQALSFFSISSSYLSVSSLACSGMYTIFGASHTMCTIIVA